MKKCLWMMIVTMMFLAPQASSAGFFGPDLPEGTVEMQAGGGDQSKVYVNGSFVFNLDHFVYDSGSHIAIFDPKIAGVVPGKKTKIQKKQETGKKGLAVIVEDEQTRSMLDSMAKDPATWKKYFEDESCDLEKALRPQVQLKKDLRPNQIIQNCSALKNQINFALANIDSSEHTVIGGGSERRKILEEKGLLPTVSLPFDYKNAVAAIQKVQDPLVIARIKAIFRDFPPDDQVIATVEKVEVVETRTPVHKTIGGQITGGKLVKTERKWSEPALSTNDVFKEKSVAALLGNLAYTDDVFVNHLKNFDFGLTNPDLDPDYVTGDAGGFLGNETITFSQWNHLSRGMYAWHRGMTFADHLWLPEENIVAGPGGLGRFISFPFYQDPLTPEQYKTAWVTWHSMVQADSVDDIRKLVLFGDVVRGVELNSPIHSAVTFKGKPLTEAKKSTANSMFGVVSKREEQTAAQKEQNTANVTWPGMMSYIMQHSIAPKNLRSVNLPVMWDVSNDKDRDPNGCNPGLTAGEWYGLVLSAGGAAVNDNKNFQEFTKALFRGDAPAAKGVVDRTVSSETLAKLVQASKANLQKADLPDDLKPKLGQAIGANPMAIYKHLEEVVTAIYNPGSQK